MDMGLFLKGVLNGPHKERKAHVKRARVIQKAIRAHGCRGDPFQWKVSDLRWVLEEHLVARSLETRYKYWRTVWLIVVRRRGKRAPDWELYLDGPWRTLPRKKQGAAPD